ncbi:hypothetical protein [Vibrio harveyi]|uniref:hypothetical protein n=1 Tax=Vibrio harveyi TaxID=669 RepID=UPI003CF0FE5D
MQKLTKGNKLCLKLYSIALLGFFCSAFLGLIASNADPFYSLIISCSGLCIISLIVNELTTGDLIEKSAHTVRCILGFNTLSILAIGITLFLVDKLSFTEVGAILSTTLTIFGATVPACISAQKNRILHAEKLRLEQEEKNRVKMARAKPKPNDWTRYLPPNFSVVK